VRDILGSLISGICVVHCIATALMFAIGGASLVTFAAHFEELHLIFILPIFALAFLSFPKSRKIHGNSTPIKIAAVGLCLVAFAIVVEIVWHLHELEVLLTVIGGLALVYAHMQNRKLIQQTSPAIG
jgi:hypothetical protein